MPPAKERWVFKIYGDGHTTPENAGDRHMCSIKGADWSVTLHIERAVGDDTIALRLDNVNVVEGNREGGVLNAHRLEMSHGFTTKDNPKGRMTLDVFDRDGKFAFWVRRENHDLTKLFLVPVVRTDV